MSVQISYSWIHLTRNSTSCVVGTDVWQPGDFFGNITSADVGTDVFQLEFSKMTPSADVGTDVWQLDDLPGSTSADVGTDVLLQDRAIQDNHIGRCAGLIRLS